MSNVLKMLKVCTLSNANFVTSLISCETSEWVGSYHE